MMSEIDAELPPKPWASMDETERHQAARKLQEVAAKSFDDMIADINGELIKRDCPLRVAGKLVVMWGREP